MRVCLSIYEFVCSFVCACVCVCVCFQMVTFELIDLLFRSGGEFLSVIEWFSVRQGTQHFTDENKVSRKWSDSVHLLPFQLNKNNTTTHRVLIVKIQNQKSIKLSYNNIYYKTHSQLYIRPTINSSKPVQHLTINVQ